MELVLLGAFCVSDIYLKGDTWNMLRAICLVSAVCVASPLQVFFGRKPLVWLGKMSMSIYLLHMIVLYMVTCRMADFLSLSWTAVVTMFVVTLALTVVLGYGYTLYVEDRINGMVDKLMARL